MRSGPKAAVSLEPLAWRSRAKTGTLEHFRLFTKRYLQIPRGVGAKKPFVLRDWQLEAVRPLFEGSSKVHLICIPRGNGKSGLTAAVALYFLLFGGEGQRILVVAQNDTSARRLLRTASRMVELSEELLERIKVFKERLEVPATDSTMMAVASEQSAVEGEDLTLGIIDELGFTDRDVYEAALLSLKRPGSKLLGIGTPSTPRMREKSPFLDLVTSARAGDPSISLVEFAAPAGSDPLDWEAIKAGNPALSDFLDADTVRAQLPPKVSMSEHKRARLGWWLDQAEGENFMPSEVWEKCARPGVAIPKGTPVIVSVDASQRHDATVVMIASVSPKPHLEVAGFWWGDGDPDFEVPISEVEDLVFDLAEEYRVREVTADPWGLSRSLQIWDNAGLPVTKFSQSTGRMSPALLEFRTAALEEQVTHADDSRLNRHMLAALLVESGRGYKVSKPTKDQHVDAAVAAVMAYSRAFWLGSKKKQKKNRSYSR